MHRYAPFQESAQEAVTSISSTALVSNARRIMSPFRRLPRRADIVMLFVLRFWQNIEDTMYFQAGEHRHFDVIVASVGRTAITCFHRRGYAAWAPRQSIKLALYRTPTAAIVAAGVAAPLCRHRRQGTAKLY